MEYKIIANPLAGRGKTAALIEHVEIALKKRNVKFDIAHTKAPGDATDLARAAAEAGWQTIISLGGDGTACEVINGLIDTDSALGIISCGTGNDIARSLRIPTDINLAIDTILAGQKRKIDVGLERDQIFTNIAGIGFSHDVTDQANSMKRLKGSLAFLAGTYRSLSQLKPMQTRIELDDEIIEADIASITISNMKYAGGGMIFAPDAIVDDGLFDVSIVGEIGKLSLALTFPQMYKEEGVKHSALSRHRSSTAKIYTDQPVGKMFDGNINGKTPLEMKVLPKAISVLVPE